MKFLSFITVCKNFWPITFLGKLLLWIQIQDQILHFTLLISNLWVEIKICLLILALFANLKTKSRQNGSKKNKKKIFYKSFLESRLTSISGRRHFVKIKSKSLYPNKQCAWALKKIKIMVNLQYCLLLCSFYWSFLRSLLNTQQPKFSSVCHLVPWVWIYS
jgi:hypothetical protein